MAYLIVKRIYQGAIVPVMSKRMRSAAAHQKVAEIAAFPEAMHNSADGIDGEIWIEVEEENTNILGDPAVFAPTDARAVLLRTGASVALVDQALADDTATAYLSELRGMMRQRFAKA